MTVASFTITREPASTLGAAAAPDAQSHTTTEPQLTGRKRPSAHFDNMAEMAALTVSNFWSALTGEYRPCFE